MYDAMEASERSEKLPTVFELETAMAIYYFYKKKCDIVILEAGLGGETDATNVSEKNLVSVITSVSLDHMNYLGDTVEKIAEVKSGIIKENSYVTVGINEEKVNEVIRRKTVKKRGIFRQVLGENITVYENTLEGQHFSYLPYDSDRGSTEILNNLFIKLPGKNQAENAATAIEAVLLLKMKMENGIKITEEAIRDGLRSAAWKGRFQVISREPVIILDGAHNPDAGARLKENIQIYLKDFNIVCIMGVFADKDYNAIINIMKPYIYRTVAVTVPGARALPAAEIKNAIVENIGENVIRCQIEEAETYDDALMKAKAMAKSYTAENGRETAIVAFGSLSYLKYIK